MQNLNTKETMARGVIVLNVSEMPQENISVGKGQNYLLVGDNAIWLKKIPDNSIDSIVTDPPAGISFMSRGWDSDKGGRDHWIAWMCEVATECKRVLKPGGHAFVWAIPRTSHWTATAWENAGFEIRDVVAHIFGSGFPKSLNIGKAVDKLQGNEREVVGDNPNDRSSHGKNAISMCNSVDGKITKGTSEWEGWGTALKPAREDWILMRKPIESKTVAQNVLKYGTGGINIDESRVFTEYYLQGNDLSDILTICQLNNLQLPANNVELKRFQDDTTSVIKSLFSVAENVDMPILEKTLGRLQEDTTRMDIQCYEEMLEDNISTSLNMYTLGKNITEKSRKDLKYIISTVLKMIIDWKIYSVSAYQLTEALLTKAKNEVNTREKSGRFPANLCHDNSEEVRECFPENRPGFSGGGQGNGWHKKHTEMEKQYFADSGNASRFFKSIIYQAKSSKSERTNGGAITNSHPTIKPIALMEYLIKMVTPKGGTVLDPFAGSGSTLVAAKQNGYQYIGIEMTEEYIPIIEARLK